LKRPVVADVMTKDVVTAQTDASYKQIVETLTEHRISGLPVIDAAGGVVGVVSEADLLYKEEFASPHQRPRRLTMRHKAARAKAASDTAGELMTTPAVTVPAQLRVGEAARILTRRGLKRLPVVDACNRLVGIVTRTDLLTVFLRGDDEIRDEIIDEVITGNLWEDPARIHVGVSDGVATLRGQLEIDTLVPIAVDLTASVPGVVDVINELTFSRKAGDQGLSSRSPVMWPW
jgi:CBS domain-containing protein